MKKETTGRPASPIKIPSFEEKDDFGGLCEELKRFAVVLVDKVVVLGISDEVVICLLANRINWENDIFGNRNPCKT